MRRVIVVLRALAALVVLGVFMLGVPYLLVRFVGNPNPVPNLSTAVGWIGESGVSDLVVVRVLATVVWLAWVRLALSVLVEVAGQVRRRPPRERRALGFNQDLAARMIAPIVVLFSTLGSGSSVHAAVTSSPSPVGLRGPVPTFVQHESATVTVQAGPARIVHHSRAASTGVDTARRDTTPGGVAGSDATWTVQRNDSLWGIAESMLGDGSRWRDVVNVNVGHEVSPGVTFSRTTEIIHPGWVLRVPGAAPLGGPTSGVITVAPGDSLSTIAERTFGDADAWSVIWNANKGRELRGGTTFDDPNHILSGWTLVLPDDLGDDSSSSLAPLRVIADRVSADEPTLSDDRGVPSLNVVPSAEQSSIAYDGGGGGGESGGAAGRTVSSLVPDAPGQRVASAAPVGHVARGGSAASVGGVFEVADEQRVVRGGPSLAGSPTGDLVPASATAVSMETDGEQRSPLGTMLGPASALLLATGTVSLLDSRRRQRMRRTPCNARLPLPSRRLVDMESQLRAVSNAERLARIDLAIRRAADALTPAGRQILAVLARSTGEIELIISGSAEEPIQSPAPLTALLEPNRWALAASVPTDSIGVTARFAAFPSPALIHLGRSGDDELFVDLEAIGLLAVAGPAHDAADIVRAVAAGLATSPFADGIHLIGSGDSLPALDRMTRVDHPDAAIDAAAGAISGVLGSLRAGDTTFALRHRSVGESWEPSVVLLAGPTDDSLDADLVSVTTPAGRGLGIFADHPIAGAAWELAATTDGWKLAPLGLTVQPIGLGKADGTVLVELIADADVPATAPSTPRRRSTTPYLERDWQLMVRVLGPVDVVNRSAEAAEFAKSKSLELVAWLADRSSTATRGAARAALWETIVRDGTFANVVSEARRALAALSPPPAGTEWIARTLTEMLPLHDEVVSDAALLEARLAHARRTADAHNAAEVLRAGLELVRDVPFAGSTYVWPDSEGRASSLLLLVVSAAGEYSRRCLEIGDHQGLFWATAKGLSVIPGHEELIALRMRGHAATGDFASIRTEFEQYERVLNADSWSDGEPSPKLVALRRELLSPAAPYAKAV